MDVRFTQNMYPSAAGGDAKISYYVLRPVCVELRGIVQISHGMCEYFTRYTAFAKYLCSLGYIVCGFCRTHKPVVIFQKHKLVIAENCFYIRLTANIIYEFYRTTAFIDYIAEDVHGITIGKPQLIEQF